MAPTPTPTVSPTPRFLQRHGDFGRDDGQAGSRAALRGCTSTSAPCPGCQLPARMIKHPKMASSQVPHVTILGLPGLEKLLQARGAVQTYVSHAVSLWAAAVAGFWGL